MDQPVSTGILTRCAQNACVIGNTAMDASARDVSIKWGSRGTTFLAKTVDASQNPDYNSIYKGDRK